MSNQKIPDKYRKELNQLLTAGQTVTIDFNDPVFNDTKEYLSMTYKERADYHAQQLTPESRLKHKKETQAKREIEKARLRTMEITNRMASVVEE